VELLRLKLIEAEKENERIKSRIISLHEININNNEKPNDKIVILND
jgi:hypothetical protein